MARPKTARPTQCDIGMPNQCMLRCRMCNFWKNGFMPSGRDWLGLEDFRRLFSDLKNFASEPFLVTFGGGEPLLADNFFDILTLCRGFGFNTYFPTNAYLLDEKIAERLAGYGAFSVGISLDGINSRTHDFLRGRKGCHERVMKAINYLNKHCPDVQVNILTIIMGANLHEIIDLTKWAYNHPGIYGIVFQAIQKPFNTRYGEDWQKEKEYAGLWPKDISKVNSVIDELIYLKRDGDKGFKICNPVFQLELFKLYFDNPRNFKKPARCHLGDGIIQVDYSGNVILCSQMSFVGNIKEESIRDIWYSKKADETRSRIYNCEKNCYHLINCFYDGKSL
jgi:MoaA/NifB/PqqE/SkfB family radical SAM enzyme